MKNGYCPSGVTGAVVSHSIWTRPANVSATADHSSTSGCSPTGWAIRSFKSVPIPTQSADSASQRNPRTPGLRINRPSATGELVAVASPDESAAPGLLALGRKPAINAGEGSYKKVGINPLH